MYATKTDSVGYCLKMIVSEYRLKSLIGVSRFPSTIAITKLVDEGEDATPFTLSLKSYLTSSTLVLRIGN